MSPRPSYWQKACVELAQNDATMAKLIKQFRGSYLEGSRDAFTILCRAVVGQQISLSAADSIWQRLNAHFGKIKPLAIHRCHLRTMRRCGLSLQKANYLKNIARFFVHQNIRPAYWEHHQFEELQTQLLNIKGVGHWTFQMFAIFYLKHPDILPLGDLGLINAIYRQYNGGTQLSPKRVQAITEHWVPWRTVATWYLWRSIDPDPVTY